MSGIETTTAPLVTQAAGDEAIAIRAGAIVRSQVKTLAITYDQQAEPTTPSAGQVWRERTAGGLIVGEWEWTGSVWAATQTVPAAFDNGGINAIFAGIVSNGTTTVQLPFLRSMAVSLVWSALVTTADAANRWDFNAGFDLLQNATPDTAATFSITAPVSRVATKTPMAALSGLNRTSFTVIATRVGAPAGLFWGGSVLVREVRS